ncbi:hypothetical protein BJ165DRAFT_1598372 [Panaeolus papilionaceus]|nr:hypothetical protein BJ165DRAFT_1598372 [Panaeolus papilionaceus]
MLQLQKHSRVHSSPLLLEQSQFHPPFTLFVGDQVGGSLYSKSPPRHPLQLQLQLQTHPLMHTAYHHYVLRFRRPLLLLVISPSSCLAISASTGSPSTLPVPSLPVSRPLQQHTQRPPPQLHLLHLVKSRLQVYESSWKNEMWWEQRLEDVREKDCASVRMANLKPPPLLSPPHSNPVSRIPYPAPLSPAPAPPSFLAHPRPVPLRISKPQTQPLPKTHKTTPDSAQSLPVSARVSQMRRSRVKRAAWRWWG